MSRASRIIVADGDAKNAGLLAFGFEREGLTPVLAHSAADLARLAGAGDADCAVVVAGDGIAAEVIRQLRGPGGVAPKLPVLLLANEEARTSAIAVGASDFLPRPMYVRDVVTLARLHTLGKGAAPTSWTGELADFAGIFYLIRALTGAQRTGVMTLVRGLRRAELRFYQGEVTSAQAGGLHGLAALHQVLLWTDGKIDFRAEAVIRRQQIPLAPAELIEDAGRFMRDFHEVAGELSAGTVLEQDLRRVAECVDKIPKEVSPVLRLFDGQRAIAEVVEDSPFRVFETVKIATRLVKLGAIRVVANARPRAGAASAALSVDDWLVGNKTPGAGVPAVQQRADSEPTGRAADEPASPPAGEDHSARRKRKSRPTPRTGQGEATSTPAAAAPGTPAPAPSTPIPSVDWGRLPATAGSVWDLPGYAPVVPSQVQTGEIASARPSPAADLAAVGKVVAQDLAAAAQSATAAVQSVLSEVSPPASVVVKPEITAKSAPPPVALAAAVPVAVAPVAVAPTPVAVAPAPAPVAPAPAPVVLGSARERVDELSARTSAAVPAAMPTSPATAPMPGPVVVPAARPAPVVVPAPAPAPVRVAAPVEIEPLPPELAPPTMAAAVAASAFPAPVAPPAHDNGVVSGDLQVKSAPVESRQSEPQAEPEKIVLIDVGYEEESQPSKPALPSPLAAAPAAPAAPFIPGPAPPTILVSPQGPPSVEIEIIRDPEPPPEAEPPVVEAAPEPVAVAAPVAAAVAAPIAVAAASPEPPPPVMVSEQVSKGASDAAQAAARAVGFDDIDHEFFDQAHKLENAHPTPVENFDDLDDHAGGGGSRRPAGPAPKLGFWRRIMGPPKPDGTPAAPARPARPAPRPTPASTSPSTGNGGGQAKRKSGSQPTVGAKKPGGGGGGGGGHKGKGGGGKKR